VGIEIQPANRARLAQMSGEERHQGVIAEVIRSTAMDEAGLRTLVEARLEAADGKPLLLLVLDGVQDPHIHTIWALACEPPMRRVLMRLLCRGMAQQAWAPR
jgi:hypothetical protein